MDPARPGWYADPEHPATLRWFDGVGWTDHRTATPVMPPEATTPWPDPAPWTAAPGGPSSGTPRQARGRRLLLAVRIAVGLVLVGVLVAAAVPAIRNVRAIDALDALSCKDVVAEAVAFSAQEATDDLIALVAVSDVELLADGRATLRRPAEDRRSFVMSCTGTGLWADDVTTPVTLTLSLDHDLEHQVAIEWEE